MITSFKTVLIGLFVVFAAAIIVFILLFLHPSVGDNAKTITVRFTNVDKVNVGTRVTYAGHPVGEVVSIKELPDARINRINQNGDVYVYELVLKVDSSVKIFNTDEIASRTSGLLGEKNVDINPQPAKPNEELFVVDDHILYASPQGSVEETLKSFSVLSDKFEQVLTDFHKVMLKIEQEEIVEKLAKTVENANQITQALNQPEKWGRSLDNLVALSDKTLKSWDEIDSTINRVSDISVRADKSWNTIDTTLNNFQSTSQKAYEIVTQTSEGKGSVGKLLVADDLYLRVKSILYKGETLLNDMNRFGVLFQNDKRWQRLQSRRLRMLQKLSTPENFTCYFNGEIDQISTSLLTVSQVLNDSTCYPQSLLNDPDFSRRFSELLRRVTEMEDSLKMYNEQIVDQD